MDDQKFGGLLSDLIPDEIEKRLGLGAKSTGEQHSRAVELLKTAAGQAGGGVESELNEFLNGRGALLETTRSAVARKKNVESEVAGFLTGQLHLSAPLAKLIAPLVIQIFPVIGEVAGAGAPVKPKPAHHTHKPKPSSSTKPAASHKPKEPKESSSSKPHKPRPSSTQPGGHRPKRTGTVDTGPEE